MWGFVAQRLLGAALTMLLATTLVFGALLLVPGDPAQTILGLEASPEALRALRHALGLDRPPVQRYVEWVGRVARGDLGTSIRYGRPVRELIGARLSLTLPLVLLSMALAAGLGTLLGSVAARSEGRRLDLTVSGFALTGLILPSFWVGLMLILVFSARLHALPSGGFPGWQHPGRAAVHLILPIATLALARAALMTRIVRGSLLEVLHEDYTRTARAKGLAERAVIIRHALRNAAIPIVTVLGLEFAQLLTAGVVVEAVFALPGLGTLVLTGIEARDYPLVQGVVLVLAGMIVGLNLLTDLLYGMLDPRVTYG
ncbi:MAG: ABC transporter permease [Armatimonadota bacterium]|nr:ABC transporter permease [Armatimonadota bacterium]